MYRSAGSIPQQMRLPLVLLYVPVGRFGTLLVPLECGMYREDMAHSDPPDPAASPIRTHHGTPTITQENKINNPRISELPFLSL